MHTIISRNIQHIASKKSMTIQSVAEQSKLPVESVRNLWYGKVTNPRVETLLAISRTFDVSINYLLGETFMKADEIALLENYRECGKHGKSRINLVARNEAKAAKKEKDCGGKHEIPCLVPQKRVEDGFIYDGCGTKYIFTSVSNAYAAIEVTNNTYAPVYCKGDQLYLEDRYPEHGETAIFVRDGIGFARKYVEEGGKYILRCISGHKEDIVLKRMDEVQCIGTCAGVNRA